MSEATSKIIKQQSKKRFEIRIANALRLAGLSFHQEFRFDKVRLYKFDFAFPDHLIAIEFEGGVFNPAKTGHTSGMGYHNNCDKYNLATLQGWRILRYTSKHLDHNGEFKIPDDVKWLISKTDIKKMINEQILNHLMTEKPDFIFQPLPDAKKYFKSLSIAKNLEG